MSKTNPKCQRMGSCQYCEREKKMQAPEDTSFATSQWRAEMLVQLIGATDPELPEGCEYMSPSERVGVAKDLLTLVLREVHDDE